jgi:hypothetical protein
MSDQLTASPVQPGDTPRALRVLALVAVCVGVAALAGAAFVLSYPGIHAFALQAGISTRLAKGYPLIFDVLLVIILAAVLSLRGAGLPSKVLAWTCLLALLAAAAGADAMHAAGRKLPAQSAAVTAAVVPWALVLIAFALLLAMLRQARLRRLATDTGAAVARDGAGRGRPQYQQVPPPLPTQPLIPGFAPSSAGPGPTDAVRLAVPRLAVSRLAVPRQVTAESAADSAGLPGPGRASAAAPDHEMALDAEPTPGNPSGDETPLPAAGEISADSAEGDVAGGDDDGDLDGAGPAGTGADRDHDGAAAAGTGADRDHDGAGQVSTLSPAPTVASETDGTADPEMPVFHRMWSSPMPPTGGVDA